MNSPQIPGFIVRPVELADAESWASYAVLPEVKQFTSSSAASVQDIRDDIQRALSGEPSAPVYFALLDSGSLSLVATVGFHTISAVNGTAEITYDVAPVHWGKGIATAACRAAALWGFSARGWHRIQATTVTQHLRSQRVLERCGFKREGLLRNLRLVRGRPTDYYLYSVIPGEVAKSA